MEVETLDRVYKDVRLVSMLAKFLGRVCPIDLVQPQASRDNWDNWSLKHSFLLMWRFLFTDWLVQWACTRGVQTVLPSGYSRSPCHQHPRHVWEGVHSICQTAGGEWWYPRSHWPVCGLLLQQGQRGTQYDILCMYTVWHILDMYTVWHMLHMSQNLQ